MIKLAFFASLLLSCACAFAQFHEEEPAAIIELGPAAERSLKDARSSFGPSIAVEVTPIEHWLELEAGVSALFNRHSTEWDVDLLFKKPWSLSNKAELMVGLGPQWTRANERGVRTNALSGEVALDFMYWPTAKRRFGWFLEPGYAYSFAGGHEQTFGISGGLLIAIR